MSLVGLIGMLISISYLSKCIEIKEKRHDVNLYTAYTVLLY